MKYSVQAAARATGISEHRLRTWERRYGVPDPERSPTGRRLYDDDDILIIRTMAHLVDAGIPASEAAAAALRGERESALPPEEPRRDPTVDRLLGHARRFDPYALESGLREALETQGKTEAITGIILPLLHDIGIEWETAQITVACEHFASEIVRRVLYSSAPPAREPVASQPTVVIACPPGEQHDLGALSLWLLLQEQPLNVLYLGADVPTAELVITCQLVRPDAMVLITTIGTAMPGMWLTARRITEARLNCRVFVGGPALRHETMLDSVYGDRLPTSMAAAADRLTRQVLANHR